MFHLGAPECGVVELLSSQLQLVNETPFWTCGFKELAV